MRRSLIVMVGMAALPLAVSGCTQLKTAVGLERQVPNEFDVVDNAPLAIPPDFNLRPPRPGASPSQQVSSTAEARETIFRAGGGTGTLPQVDGQLTPGETDLLVAAGAQNAPPNIRQLVNQEATADNPFGQSFVDRLLNWRRDNAEAKKSLLDPVKEEARLQERKGAETTVSTQFSSPPTIERKSETGSFFDHLF